MKIPWQTVVDLVRHFAKENRFVLIPLLVVLMLAALLLAITTGLSIVTPFVYALF